MVNQSKKAGLGRTLQRVQRVANRRKNPRLKDTDKYTLDDAPNKDNARLDLKSVLAQTNLDEFLEEAELAGKQFVTERRNLALINDNDQSKTEMYGKHERIVEPESEEVEDFTLTVPRRPKWDSTTTPEQLDEMEKRSFLIWRRKLARLQEKGNVTLTPFEKNLEVWRQLWRVVERSDIVVQILDCRNPLLYLCDDLIKYVDEDFKGKKLNLVLLNKADFLTKEQRLMWADYFKERNIKVIFFSALYENETPDKSSTKVESNGKPHDEQDSDDSNSTTSDENEMSKKLANHLNIDQENSQGEHDDEYRIYNKYELIDAWRDVLHKRGIVEERQCNKDAEQILGKADAQTAEAGPEHSTTPSRPLTVGLVGYPNVGKSSTINALLSAKRVAVSATPGKTKHFQTFLIDRDMMLCDCPGLVFPNFVSSKSEMVINGILPIDQMKDCVGPVRLIVERIPRGFFEDIYGLAFDHDAKQNITAEDLLNAFGFMRGYMTGRGLPDVARASRKICKDYLNGKILYCVAPPNVDRGLYNKCSRLAEAMRMIEAKMADPNYALKITERQSRLMKQARGADINSRRPDPQYYQEKSSGIHTKSLPGIGNLTQPVGQLNEIKVSKHERKHKKKEKLRRVYRYLDE
jgi:large subunit GTPase 1